MADKNEGITTVADDVTNEPNGEGVEPTPVTTFADDITGSEVQEITGAEDKTVKAPKSRAKAKG